MTSIFKRHSAGTTLVETLVAVSLIAVFFATIFELNAACLRYIEASKESVAAQQGVQDRLEALRNLMFTDLTSTDTANNPNCVPNLMQNPANGSDLAQKVTEVVTLSAYPTPDASNTVITRGPGTAVVPTINTTDSLLATSATLLKVNVTYTWHTALGGRPRSQQAETIISAGTKK
jgi:Tfp pilus assembly protein PilV